jgi:ParB-like chromosome segregation protein Spo0J|tara:strand:- start:171 stop:806 length:636 start_codon:yes stop_codon:yes gene_type:complete
MDIKLVSPQDILPYQNNPRNNSEAVSVVATSIQEYGFRQPIVVDEENIILAGHTRHLASLELGLDAVPVHVAANLTEAQKASFRLMDNKSSEMSTWDRDMLKSELAKIADFDIDMQLTGFSLEEIARLSGDALLQFATEVDDDDPVEEVLGDYEITNVKMVHLYLNTETEPKFREMCASLESFLGTDNMTDTVYKVVENAVDRKRATQNPV